MTSRLRSTLIDAQPAPFLHIEGVMMNIIEYVDLNTVSSLISCSKDLSNMGDAMISTVLVSQCFGRNIHAGTMSADMQTKCLKKIAERGKNDSLFAALKQKLMGESGLQYGFVDAYNPFNIWLDDMIASGDFTGVVEEPLTDEMLVSLSTDAERSKDVRFNAIVRDHMTGCFKLYRSTKSEINPAAVVNDLLRVSGNRNYVKIDTCVACVDVSNLVVDNGDDSMLCLVTNDEQIESEDVQLYIREIGELECVDGICLVIDVEEHVSDKGVLMWNFWRDEEADEEEEFLYLPVHIAFTNIKKNIMAIGAYVSLAETCALSLDFRCLTDVTRIGKNFVGCEEIKNFSLLSVRFGRMDNLITIGNSFLQNCTVLKSIDLGPLRNASQIGGSFLYGCGGMKSIDLTPFCNITSVGGYFLSYCKRISSIDLQPLQNITSINDNFLKGCKELNSIDFTPLRNITSVGEYFLRYCERISSIDLQPLQNITSINNSFLYGCGGLKSIDLTPLRNITSVGDHFLGDCSGISSIELQPLQNITSIDDWFLHRCSGLKSIDLTPLRNITSIDAGFLYGCKGLKSIDLTPLCNVTSVGGGFLVGTDELESIELKEPSAVIDAAIARNQRLRGIDMVVA